MAYFLLDGQKNKHYIFGGEKREVIKDVILTGFINPSQLFSSILFIPKWTLISMHNMRKLPHWAG